MTNTKNNTNELTRAEIIKLLQLKKGMDFALTEEEIKKYKPILEKKITLSEAFDLIDVGTTGLINLAKLAVRDSKLLSIIVTDKLDIKEADWTRAEKAVDAEAKKQEEELAKKVQEANKQVVKENNTTKEKPSLHIVGKDSK